MTDDRLDLALKVLRIYEETVTLLPTPCEVGSVFRFPEAPSLHSLNFVRVDPGKTPSAAEAAERARAIASREGLNAIVMDDRSFGPNTNMFFEVEDGDKYWSRERRLIYAYEGDHVEPVETATRITLDEFVEARSAFYDEQPDKYAPEQVADELTAAREIAQRWRTERWGVRVEDSLVSTGELYLFDNTAQLESLATLPGPSHRRKGHGRAVTLARVNRAQELGAELVFAQIDARETPSCALHEQLGFRYLGDRTVFVRKDDPED